MRKHLPCPFQMREQDIIVDDIPRVHLQDDQRTANSLCILVDEPLMKIPLEIDGIMSGFTVRIPTDAEIADREQNMTTHVNMPSTVPWEPVEMDFAEKEEAMARSMTSDYMLRHAESWDLHPLCKGTRLALAH
jgi:hypothetical protein